jgi:hypothetical protein
MDEIGKALVHGWTWRARDPAGSIQDATCHTTDLASDDGDHYQKVHCGGIPVAYIKVGPDGSRAFLLPPEAGLADLRDDEE